MPTKTKKAPKQELIDESEPIMHEALFELKKYEMKGDDLAWRMKLELKTRLNHSFREYDVRMTLNEYPFEMRISDLERKKAEVADEATLFPDQRKTQIKNIDKDIKEIEAELQELRDNCPDIEFKGTIEELKYKDAVTTVIVMLFPADTLAELNDQRLHLGRYKLELSRK